MPVVVLYQVQLSPGSWTPRHYMYTIERKITAPEYARWRLRCTEYEPPGPFPPLPEWVSEEIPGDCWSQPYVDIGSVYVASETNVYGWTPFDFNNGAFSGSTTPLYVSQSIGGDNQSSVCCPFRNVSYDITDSRLYVGSNIGTIREFGPL
jgi:hypothetical protein